MMQVCGQVMGRETAVPWTCRESFFEPNVGMPMMVHNLMESIRLLSSACRVFADRCVARIEADEKRCAELIEGSLAICTSLARLLGYDKAADIAKEACKPDETVRQVARERKALSDEQLDNALNPMSRTKPG